MIGYLSTAALAYLVGYIASMVDADPLTKRPLGFYAALAAVGLLASCLGGAAFRYLTP